MQEEMQFEMDEELVGGLGAEPVGVPGGAEGTGPAAEPARLSVVSEQSPTIQTEERRRRGSRFRQQPLRLPHSSFASQSQAEDLGHPQLRLHIPQSSSVSQSQAEDLCHSVRENEFMEQVREKLRELRQSPDPVTVRPDLPPTDRP